MVSSIVQDLQLICVLQRLVHIQDATTGIWSTGAVVTEICNSGRSYMIRTENGIFRRNRRFLRPDLGQHNLSSEVVQDVAHIITPS